MNLIADEPKLRISIQDLKLIFASLPLNQATASLRSSSAMLGAKSNTALRSTAATKVISGVEDTSYSCVRLNLTMNSSKVTKIRCSYGIKGFTLN